MLHLFAVIAVSASNAFAAPPAVPPQPVVAGVKAAGVTLLARSRRVPIAGRPRATLAQAQRWARRHGATRRFVANARLYWQIAPRRRVRPEVAYAQSAKETNFGRFGGVLDASFRNPAGIKRAAGGGNSDPRAHKRFASWRQGITAQVDHLALYAGVRGYPLRSTPDPRHFPFLRGRARTVEGLGGNWAPARDYGTSLACLVRQIIGS